MMRAHGWLHSALVVFACAGLSGCGSSSPPQTFDLSAATAPAPHASRRQMVVAEPTATLPIDSDRVVVRTGPDAIAYLSGAQWADRLPRILQTRLIETFENAHLLRNVGRPGLAADISLITEIRRFEIDVTAGMAVVEFSVKLVGDPSGRIVAAKLFKASAPSPSSGAPAMTAAVNQALGEVLRQIVLWTAGRA